MDALSAGIQGSTYSMVLLSTTSRYWLMTMARTATKTPASG
jgi:hypothetical protein